MIKSQEVFQFSAQSFFFLIIRTEKVAGRQFNFNGTDLKNNNDI